jgi:hypothetical protein
VAVRWIHDAVRQLAAKGWKKIDEVPRRRGVVHGVVKDALATTTCLYPPGPGLN